MLKYIQITDINIRNKINGCKCDRCGTECIQDEYEYWQFSDVDIYPKWIASEDGRRLGFQLCPECTFELLEFFTVFNKEEKYKHEENKEHLEFYLEN